MSQMSLFSAEIEDPAIADLAGLLAAQGQSVHTSWGARVSVVVADEWRAEEICAEIRGAGLEAEILTSEEGRPLARTEANPRITALHRAWSAGAVKAVPEGWTPTPHALRLWTLASGRPDGAHYLLGLDPHAPDTHAPLSTSLMRIGIAPTLVGVKGGAHALRVSSRKRITRLAETVGIAPEGAPDGVWPAS
ncbi:hypothetical protein [Gordonia neofelifaecis]|uniref:Uncharacterized protein n=1 Tax=Gordonia neofelifaecis NRRL B-59395 TaxID=644548 RepID=F1YJX6_9ACTN|nr:hypothetical protein [Gordonia neofelifaecis]EGD55058.1 hypothetical protein SCNU_11031 [Gordonia neofelifaecis NRRL B-59395]